MSDYIIKVENLGKMYRIRHQQPERYTALRDVLARKVSDIGSSVFSGVRSWVRGPGPNGTVPSDLRPDTQYPTPNPQHLTPNTQYPIPNTQPPTPKTEDFWALRGVSFEVKRGEVVGIIGRNGAGKTTLLKILSRITEPTEGRVRIRGRVASLLEVGTGFHPELTGRENIYLNGAVLGMTRAEIKSKFDEIVAFAEVEKFLDTPVKRYSSGMYVRLAFAVAAHLEPEILLVDEVLAVGDASFQKKCLGKMGDVAREGRTVLFVSHNMAAVRSLCFRSVLLDRGQVIVDRLTEITVTRYLMSTATSLSASVDTSHLPRPSNIISSVLRITRVSIVNGTEQAILFCENPFELALEFVVSEPLTEVVFGWSVHSSDNVRLFECRSVDKMGVIPRLESNRYVIHSSLRNNPLNPGLYTLYVGARCANAGLDYLPSVMSFQVDRTDRQESLWLEARSGALSLDSEWTRPTRNCVHKEQQA